MSNTRVSQVIVFVGDNDEDITLDVRDGQLVIGLGSGATLDLADANLAVLDRLAVVTANAALTAHNRALQEVA